MRSMEEVIYKIFNGNKNKIILTTGNVQDIAQKLNKKKYSIYSLPIWGKKTKKQLYFPILFLFVSYFGVSKLYVFVSSLWLHVHSQS